MAAEVFISYASQNRDRILDLVERLRGAGVSVWIDQMGIEGAAMWSQQIVAAIRDCKVLILAISKNSATSENVVKELALASEGRKRILPVFIEEADIPETMAYQLAGIQRVEFFEGNEEAGLKAVIRALSTLDVDVCSDATAAAGAEAGQAVRRHHHNKSEAKREISIWLKVATGVVALAVLSLAGTIFMDSSTAPAPGPVALGQAQTNTAEQTQPLAKPVALDTDRVVVLPFKVIGTANETADMGYGLVSTLTSKLQPLQNLVVIAKESARKFKDSEKSPREIGQALGAGTIVTGEIQTGGGNIQVNIQLINANTEALGWGSTFTKSQDDFLDMQNEIATKLASELKGGLDAAEAQQLVKKATENAEAQSEYQAGRREWNKRSKQGFENAIKHFERAIELDPSYADPYVGLGDTYGLLSIYNFSPASEAMPKAKSYARQALEINPSFPGAYTSLAWVLHKYEYDWAGAEQNYRKAIELNPNHATANHWYGIFLFETRRGEKAVERIKIATQLAPNSKIIQHSYAEANWRIGRDADALKAAEKSLLIDPNFPFALRQKHVMLGMGTPEDSIKRFEEALAVYPNQPVLRHGLFDLYWKAGKEKEAMEQVIELLDRYHDSYEKARFAEIFFVMGKHENGYRWLEEAIEARESTVPRLPKARELKMMHSEPRFRELYKKINHPVYADK